MGPITSIIPMPVPCPLGGVVFQVWEARLRDIAELQSALDSRAPDPMAGIAEIDANPDSEVRRKGLLAALEIAEAGPGIYGTPSGQAYFDTLEGRLLLLWAALKRAQPNLTAEDIEILAKAQKPGEFDRIYRVFHGVDALRSIERILLGPPPNSPAGRGQVMTWAEAIDGLARERGWSYEQIYDLSLSEWMYARRSGKAAPRGRQLVPGENPAEALAEMRRRVYGESVITAKGGES